MKEMIVVDSSILIEFFRRKDKSQARFADIKRDYNRIVISTITEYEIYLGVNKNDVEFWREIFSSLIILPVDREIAQTAALLQRDLKRQRKQLGLGDLLIAATATVYGLPVATLDKDHFTRVPGLDVY